MTETLWDRLRRTLQREKRDVDAALADATRRGNAVLDEKERELSATPEERLQIEQERAALLKRAAVDRESAEAQRDQMASISLNFERKAGEHGTLFGSVTSMDVAEALQAKGYEIDRRKIVLKDAIKETGEYTVNVKLYRDVILAVPVIVTAEGGETEAKPERKAKKEAKPKVEEVKAEAPIEEVAAAPAVAEEEVAAEAAEPTVEEAAASEETAEEAAE